MPSNLVVLLHIAGNALACVRDGEAVRVRAIRKSTAKPGDQAGALALLRVERKDDPEPKSLES